MCVCTSKKNTSTVNIEIEPSNVDDIYNNLRNTTSVISNIKLPNANKIFDQAPLLITNSANRNCLKIECCGRLGAFECGFKLPNATSFFVAISRTTSEALRTAVS